MYKLLKQGVFRESDGANIPDDSGNADWQEYQKWLGDGGTPEPADLLSAEEVAATARKAIDEQERQQAKLDAQILNDINMSPVGVSDKIETLFPAFTNPQRTFLKRLVRLAQIGARDKLR